MLVREIAALLNAQWEGQGDRDIRKVADLDSAQADEIAFVAGRKAAAAARRSSAGCLIVPLDFENAGRRTIIRSSQPRASIAAVIHRLHPKKRPPAGVHPTAVIGSDTVIGEGASIGANTVIGDNVRIGEHAVIHPNVTIYDDVSIGSRTVVHAGAVIGADGFGFILREGAYENFPQVGRVEIGDDVEIGANCCVDRAALGVTRIGDGTKLDNMVHVGHNCSIGRHVVIAAQTGLAGGVVIEDYAVIGGQVGIGDKARIQSRAILGSGAGVLTSKIIRGGQVFWGTPARPLKEHLEQLAALSRLPEIRQEWLALKQKLRSAREL
ncbi:MAG TPA: UDP-3-O-(3-hydroxymyristoyl)glucosamine N-acyltransferase [Bryobacteraceae bacterium]|nr:UDP-3-O-(3-hydroxymyristoyl)glucosamine N-acyltransferase [Bryobacteraceae bacterium]